MPEFGEVELNESDYKKVLEKSYDGYELRRGNKKQNQQINGN